MRIIYSVRVTIFTHLLQISLFARILYEREENIFFFFFATKSNVDVKLIYFEGLKCISSRACTSVFLPNDSLNVGNRNSIKIS